MTDNFEKESADQNENSEHFVKEIDILQERSHNINELSSVESSENLAKKNVANENNEECLENTDIQFDKSCAKEFAILKESTDYIEMSDPKIVEIQPIEDGVLNKNNEEYNILEVSSVEIAKKQENQIRGTNENSKESFEVIAQQGEDIDSSSECTVNVDKVLRVEIDEKLENEIKDSNETGEECFKGISILLEKHCAQEISSRKECTDNIDEISDLNIALKQAKETDGVNVECFENMSQQSEKHPVKEIDRLKECTENIYQMPNLNIAEKQAIGTIGENENNEKCLDIAVQYTKYSVKPSVRIKDNTNTIHTELDLQIADKCEESNINANEINEDCAENIPLQFVEYQTNEIGIPKNSTNNMHGWADLEIAENETKETNDLNKNSEGYLESNLKYSSTEGSDETIDNEWIKDDTKEIHDTIFEGNELRFSSDSLDQSMDSVKPVSILNIEKKQEKEYDDSNNRVKECIEVDALQLDNQYSRDFCNSNKRSSNLLETTDINTAKKQSKECVDPNQTTETCIIEISAFQFNEHNSKCNDISDESINIQEELNLKILEHLANNNQNENVESCFKYSYMQRNETPAKESDSKIQLNAKELTFNIDMKLANEEDVSTEVNTLPVNKKIVEAMDNPKENLAISCKLDDLNVNKIHSKDYDNTIKDTSNTSDLEGDILDEKRLNFIKENEKCSDLQFLNEKCKNKLEILIPTENTVSEVEIADKLNFSSHISSKFSAYDPIDVPSFSFPLRSVSQEIITNENNSIRKILEENKIKTSILKEETLDTNDFAEVRVYKERIILKSPINDDNCLLDQHIEDESYKKLNETQEIRKSLQNKCRYHIQKMFSSVNNEKYKSLSENNIVKDNEKIDNSLHIRGNVESSENFIQPQKTSQRNINTKSNKILKRTFSIDNVNIEINNRSPELFRTSSLDQVISDDSHNILGPLKTSSPLTSPVSSRRCIDPDFPNASLDDSGSEIYLRTPSPLPTFCQSNWSDLRDLIMGRQEKTSVSPDEEATPMNQIYNSSISKKKSKKSVSWTDLQGCGNLMVEVPFERSEKFEAEIFDPGKPDVKLTTFSINSTPVDNSTEYDISNILQKFAVVRNTKTSKTVTNSGTEYFEDEIRKKDENVKDRSRYQLEVDSNKYLSSYKLSESNNTIHNNSKDLNLSYDSGAYSLNTSSESNDYNKTTETLDNLFQIVSEAEKLLESLSSTSLALQRSAESDYHTMNATPRISEPLSLPSTSSNTFLSSPNIEWKKHYFNERKNTIKPTRKFKDQFFYKQHEDHCDDEKESISNDSSDNCFKSKSSSNRERSFMMKQLLDLRRERERLNNLIRRYENYSQRVLRPSPDIETFPTYRNPVNTHYSPKEYSSSSSGESVNNEIFSRSYLRNSSHRSYSGKNRASTWDNVHPLQETQMYGDHKVYPSKSASKFLSKPYRYEIKPELNYNSSSCSSYTSSSKYSLNKSQEFSSLNTDYYSSLYSGPIDDQYSSMPDCNSCCVPPEQNSHHAYCATALLSSLPKGRPTCHSVTCSSNNNSRDHEYSTPIKSDKRTTSSYRNTSKYIRSKMLNSSSTSAINNSSSERLSYKHYVPRYQSTSALSSYSSSSSSSSVLCSSFSETSSYKYPYRKYDTAKRWGQ